MHFKLRSGCCMLCAGAIMWIFGPLAALQAEESRFYVEREAAALFEVGEYGAALAAYQKLLNQNKDFWQKHPEKYQALIYNLGTAFAALGHAQEALAAFQSIPSDEGASPLIQRRAWLNAAIVMDQEAAKRVAQVKDSDFAYSEKLDYALLQLSWAERFLERAAHADCAIKKLIDKHQITPKACPEKPDLGQAHQGVMRQIAELQARQKEYATSGSARRPPANAAERSIIVIMEAERLAYKQNIEAQAQMDEQNPAPNMPDNSAKSQALALSKNLDFLNALIALQKEHLSHALPCHLDAWTYILSLYQQGYVAALQAQQALKLNYPGLPIALEAQSMALLYWQRTWEKLIEAREEASRQAQAPSKSQSKGDEKSPDSIQNNAQKGLSELYLLLQEMDNSDHPASAPQVKEVERPW